MKRTQRSRVKGMLRQIWLKSAERNEALKRDNYTCQHCNRKQSRKKGQEFRVEVHHKKGVNVWDELIDLIMEHLLCNPDDLETLCVECHKAEERNKTNQ